MIHSYNKSQRDALFPKIYLIKYSTCFGQVHCPSSGVSQHCIRATGICHGSSVGCLLTWRDLYCSVNKIRANKSREMRLLGYVACEEGESEEK